MHHWNRITATKNRAVYVVNVLRESYSVIGLVIQFRFLGNFRRYRAS